ncbi:MULTISPECIES: hypothetical protein [unclassified Lactonifactor]|uniref:hypothetical protein n=1 Tax=unclassified Lactonifactor TaxID=2636670 RepID=UPI0018FE7633|nr:MULTISPECIES: hypothetical protein [unclassified Lactonifactor]
MKEPQLMFPKGAKKKKRKVHKKSILQDKDDHRCYLCLLQGNNQYYPIVHEHHVFGGTANRPLSEKYGLKVYLCPDHHQFSAEAVHVNAENSLVLKQAAQEAFEQEYTREEFVQIFGRNYL